jgi:hypothetical protein
LPCIFAHRRHFGFTEANSREEQVNEIGRKRFWRRLRSTAVRLCPLLNACGTPPPVRELPYRDSAPTAPVPRGDRQPRLLPAQLHRRARRDMAPSRRLSDPCRPWPALAHGPDAGKKSPIAVRASGDIESKEVSTRETNPGIRRRGGAGFVRRYRYGGRHGPHGRRGNDYYCPGELARGSGCLRASGTAAAFTRVHCLFLPDRIWHLPHVRCQLRKAGILPLRWWEHEVDKSSGVRIKRL